MEVSGETLFGLEEDAVAPGGDSGLIGGVIVIRVEIVFVGGSKVKRRLLEVTHYLAVFLRELVELLVFVQLFIVLGGNEFPYGVIVEVDPVVEVPKDHLNLMIKHRVVYVRSTSVFNECV